MNQLTRSFLVALVILVCESRNFAQLEVVKVDRMVALNGAYPSEVSKAEHKCIDEDCGDKLYFAITLEENEKIAHISFSKDKPTSEALQYTTFT